MSEQTDIAWTDSTINFWSGCTKVSAGCANCYAETLAKRFDTFGKWGTGAPRKLHESAFKLAKKLAKRPFVCDECGKAFPTGKEECDCAITFHRRRIFANSMSDWLDPEVPIEWLARMLDVIRKTPKCDWLLVTKRPEHFTNQLLRVGGLHSVDTEGNPLAQWLTDWHGGKPPRNVWIIASVENHEMAEKRIPTLLRIPAVVRGLSVEPMLGPIKIFREVCAGCGKEDCGSCPAGTITVGPSHNGAKIGWVIFGGESGKNARPCNTDWIRDGVRQCKAASVLVFVKQLGSFVTLPKDSMEGFAAPMLQWYPCANDGTGGYGVKTKHRSGADPSEWPDDLRVQQFPKANI